MATRKNHYYMASTLIYFEKDGAMKQKYMNIVLQASVNQINHEVLNQGRMAVLQRMKDEFEIPPEAIKDFIYMNLSHMGYMSDAEFSGSKPAHR